MIIENVSEGSEITITQDTTIESDVADNVTIILESGSLHVKGDIGANTTIVENPAIKQENRLISNVTIDGKVKDGSQIDLSIAGGDITVASVGKNCSIKTVLCNMKFRHIARMALNANTI